MSLQTPHTLRPYRRILLLTTSALLLSSCVDGLVDPDLVPSAPSVALFEGPGVQSYATDWSGYAVGVQPTGWSQRWDPTPHYKVADAGAPAGAVLQWDATGTSRNRWGLAYDGFGDVGDQEVYTEFRVRSLGGGAPVFYMGAAAVRIGGTAANEQGYALFFVSPPSGGSRAVVLSSWVNGAYRQFGQLNLAWNFDEWYSVRLQAVGDSIKGRVWSRGQNEPVAWHFAVRDTLYRTGRPGVANHDNGAVQWDYWRGAVMSGAGAMTALELDPPSASVVAGGTVQFTAKAHYANGTSAPVAAAFAASGGSISAAGLFAAGSATGSYQVIATHASGLADTAAVTIVAPTVALAYVTGFENGVVGLLPPEWVETSAPAGADWTVSAGAGSSDGRSLRSVITSTGRHILRLVPVADSTTTQEILTRMSFADSDVRGSGVALRHTMGTRESAYVAYFRPSLGQIEINAFVDGGWIFLGAANFPNSPGNWYWLRFRAEGNNLRVRAWADGQPEPSTWALSAVNSALPVGSAGLYSYEPNTVDYDAVSVATAGNSAATPAAGNPPPAPTLVALVLNPDSVDTPAGGTVQFTASGVLSDGSSSSVSASFSATGGTVTSSGLFTAGGVSGAFRVTATDPLTGLSDSSVVVIPPPPPAGFDHVTHFASDALGQAPAGWSETAYPTGSDWRVEQEAGAIDGRSLRNIVTTTGRHILRLESIAPSTAPQEILVRMRMADADTRGPGVALRHSMGSAESAYVAYLRPTQNVVEINAFVNGVWQFLSAATFQNDPGVWYWLRFRVEGTSLRVRAWADGQQEPSGWTSSATNGALPGGSVGLYTYEPNTIDYDLVSVSVGGASAATP